jgi:hypothetical protein
MAMGTAAMQAWRTYGAPQWGPEIDYATLWTWYSGTWTSTPAMMAQQASDPDLYLNTRQIWRQSSAIVNLYDQFVYMGDLSTNGEPLPDGSPWEPSRSTPRPGRTPRTRRSSRLSASASPCGTGSSRCRSSPR